jgi:hypothetical protein
MQNQPLGIQSGLLALAAAEVGDANKDLSPFPLLDLNARVQLTVARAFLQSAMSLSLTATRRSFVVTALESVTAANARLGTGLTFTM